MSYSPQTFVADEQPTTAKWNLLWSNDASFNDGTGIADDAIIQRHVAAGEVFENINYQTDNSNSIASTNNAAIKLQAGWGQVLGSGAVNTETAVAFPSAFSTILGVNCSMLGYKLTTAAANIGELIGPYSISYGAHASDITTSGFNIELSRPSGTMTNTAYFGYSWIAWGLK